LSADPTDPKLPPLYLALREATDALAEAERRRSLRVSLDRTLAKEVRRVVELEAHLRDEKIGILPLARLDWEAELARIAGPQDGVDDVDPATSHMQVEIAIRREAIRTASAEANTLSETKETVEFARRVFDDALAAWSASLRDKDTQPARRLQRVDTEQATLLATAKEIDEAIAAATEAGKALDATIQGLERAATNYRSEDFVADSERTAVEEAAVAARLYAHAQHWLVLLHAELADVDDPYCPALKPPKPVRLMTEEFFRFHARDPRYVDWEGSHGRVRAGARKVGEMRTHLARLLDELQRLRAKAETDLEALDVQRWQLLLDPPFAIEDPR